MRTQAGLEVQHHSISNTVQEGARAEIQDPSTLPPSIQTAAIIDNKAGWVPGVV